MTAFSSNEWDPLEQVIVGSVDGAVMHGFDHFMRATAEAWYSTLAALHSGGGTYPLEIQKAAAEELDGLADALASLGIDVVRPSPVNHDGGFGAPEWDVPRGFSNANPRDSVIVIDDLIIEAPMADRSRYFETFAYRPHLLELARNGARWISAPKPMLTDDAYRQVTEPRVGEFATTDWEILFDAADFMRTDEFLIGQRSHTTNPFGIRWLAQMLEGRRQVRLITNKDKYVMHIDTTVVPLRRGLMFANPEYCDLDEVRRVIPDWQVVECVEPPPENHLHYLGGVGAWIGMNLLVVSPELVVVEENQIAIARQLAGLGFEVMLLPFEHVYAFGGSFHCATLDTRRRPA